MMLTSSTIITAQNLRAQDPAFHKRLSSVLSLFGTVSGHRYRHILQRSHHRGHDGMGKIARISPVLFFGELFNQTFRVWRPTFSDSIF
jgi:hypothetical protein